MPGKYHRLLPSNLNSTAKKENKELKEKLGKQQKLEKQEEDNDSSPRSLGFF